ncbi:MAG: fibronectin type III domain-containing protein, partial [Calditrichaeota bacterium]
MKIFVIALLLLPLSLFAQADNIVDSLESDTTTILKIAPPTSVLAENYKYDDADKIQLTWVPSIDDQPVPGNPVDGYHVYRITDEGEAVLVSTVGFGKSSIIDEGLTDESSYKYIISAFSKNYEAKSATTAAVTPEREWLNFGLTSLFIIALIMAGAVI